MLKQMLYAGIGLAAVTKEKAEEVVADLIKKGEMSKEEGKDVLNTLINRMQDESEKLKQKINEQVENTITSMNLVRKSELDEVSQRLTELEQKLNEIMNEKEV